MISGIDGNPLAVLAKQLGIPLHRINDDTPFYFSDGSTVNREIDIEVIYCLCSQKYTYVHDFNV